MAGRVTVRPVSENDLPLLRKLAQDPQLAGEFELYGWYAPMLYQRGWEKNRRPARDPLAGGRVVGRGALQHPPQRSAQVNENDLVSDYAAGDPGKAGPPPGPPDVRMRAAGPDDAAALLGLKRRLDQETSFMLLEAGERDASVPALARELETAARSGNSSVIVAEIGGELVGYVELTGGTFHRNQATVYVVIGVLAAAGGKGVGRGLLEEGKRWAAAHGMHRLELTVMAHNHRAIGLYQRTGFSIEGRRSECLLIDGQFIDELYMAMVLPQTPADPA